MDGQNIRGASASPAPGKPPSSAVEFAQTVEDAQAELAAAAQTDVFARDPYCKALAGLHAFLGVLPHYARSIENNSRAVVTSFGQLSDRPMLPPYQTQQLLEGLRKEARAAIREEAKEAYRRLEWRELVAIGGIILAASALFFWLGGNWKETSANNRIAAQQARMDQQKAELKAMVVAIELDKETLRLSPADAAAWVKLIKNNMTGIDTELRRAEDVKWYDGRYHGKIDVWIDPPAVAPAKKP